MTIGDDHTNTVLKAEYRIFVSLSDDQTASMLIVRLVKLGNFDYYSPTALIKPKIVEGSKHRIEM